MATDQIPATRFFNSSLRCHEMFSHHHQMELSPCNLLLCFPTPGWEIPGDQGQRLWMVFSRNMIPESPHSEAVSFFRGISTCCMEIPCTSGRSPGCTQMLTDLFLAHPSDLKTPFFSFRINYVFELMIYPARNLVLDRDPEKKPC